MSPSVLNRVKKLRQRSGRICLPRCPPRPCSSRQSINSIERDRYIPSLTLALTFAQVFKCPTDQIFQLEKRK